MPKSTRSFQQRSETFGLRNEDSWALNTLRLLYSAPRVYKPLLDSWETLYPGTKKALDRMVAEGWVTNQSPVIINTRSGSIAQKSGSPVVRYRTTHSGRRLVNETSEDLRYLEERFPNLSPSNLLGVAKLLTAMDLRHSHGKLGISANHASELANLAPRTGRWWVAKLEKEKLITRLPQALPDTRELVPEHWRITKHLTLQLKDILNAFPQEVDSSLRHELRLARVRVLGDISPARVGLTGASDFDHDVTAQRLMSAFMLSPRFLPNTAFSIEPRLTLATDMNVSPWTFNKGAQSKVVYQPDALFREKNDQQGPPLRSLLEYERYQTRRSGWSHIERALGYVHTQAHFSEGVTIRFVVDSEKRVRAYRQLIEAFADHILDHPEFMPANPVLLAVGSIERLLKLNDPLDPRHWVRIQLANGQVVGTRSPVLHDESNSPYMQYFSRG